jgi:predicted dehydrogenase
LAHELDAVLIAVNTPNTPIVLAEAVKANIPILVEKPVAPSAADLSVFLDDPDQDRIMVGYNRRHYSSVAAARAMIRDAEGAATFHASIPEASWDAEMDAASKRDFLLFNSVHILDLLNYLFGRLHLAGVSGIEDSTGVVSRVGTLTTDPAAAVKSCGTVLVSFGSPSGYFIDIHTPGKSASLRPIELFQEFTGIHIVSPTPAIPLRRYISTPGAAFTLSPYDVEFKPGFHSQALEFLNSVTGAPTPGGRKSATLDDAAHALSMAEQLLRGQTTGNTSQPED